MIYVDMAQIPNLVAGPEPVETANLHFKLICKLKIFETSEKYEEAACSIVAVSQHYGLVFVGNLNGFSVIPTKLINGDLDFNNYPKIDIVLNLKPSHISVDFTQKVLAVVCCSKPSSVLILYNMDSFSLKFQDFSHSKVTPLSKVVPNPAAEVVELAWQPKVDGTLVLCMSDGSVVALSQENQGSALCSLPNSAQATCVCWSPKGKQIVIGSALGTISQYKPDLKLVKTLFAPPLFNGAVTVVNILWVSSFQFAVAYNDRNNPESFPIITIYNAVKNEPVNVINYDDITFSNTLFRHHQIYMIHNSAWNLIFVSSANSIEVAVLHSVDNLAWEQWLLGDASRAELPLNADRQETFPLGLAFDFTSEEKITWGEKILPPMPRLYILSDEGVLCIFNVLNTTENAPQLCSLPKESIDCALFTNKTFASSVPEASKITQTSKTVLVQPVTTFDNTKPTYGFGTGFAAYMTQPQSTSPQVTISIQGGPVIGSVKEASLILQQQLQQQQGQQSSPMLVIKQQSPQVMTIKQQTPQVVTVQQSITPSPRITQMTSAVTSTTPPLFGATPTISFGAPNVNPLFGAKASLTSTNTQSPKFLPPQGDIFGGKSILQSTPIKQAEPTPEKSAVKQTPPKKSEEVVDPPAKGEEVSPLEQVPSESIETPELPAVDDGVYWSALQDEIEHFNSELHQLSERVGTLSVKIGTEEVKMNMKKSIDDLYAFWKELKETTVSQSNEIHSIVMDLMESFAWLEDAKSRNLQRKNPSFIELKKSEELDPLSAKHMNEISHLKYYIENQLKQLMTHVEKEWMDHQENYRMEVKNRMAVPPLEEVYKTMHYQLKILDKQRALVEDLREKMAAKKRNTKSHTSLAVNNTSLTLPDSQGSNRTLELSKLAENLLQLKITKAENHPKFETREVMKAHLKIISERSKKLTLNKQATLRDVLSERDMVKIRPVKTTFESSSFLRSLPLEKDLKRTTKKKQETKALGLKEKEKLSPCPVIVNGAVDTKPKQDVKPEVTESREKTESIKTETPKSIFVFGSGLPAQKPIIPLAAQSLPKPEEKSPLAALSGIVKNIGKENETKPKPQVSSFSFNSNFQKQETPKEIVVGTGEPEQKVDQTKTTKPFTFDISKPAEPVFGKNEPTKFGTKLTFGFPVTTQAVPSTSMTAKTTSSTTVTVSAALVTTNSSTFSLSFTSTTTAANSSAFSKMNLLVSGKEQNSGFGTKSPTLNLFSMGTTSTSNTSTSTFGTSTSIFGTGKATAETKLTTSLFGVPKIMPESVTQPSGFTFIQPVENKNTQIPSVDGMAATLVKPTSETEEVEVVVVEEESKKSEATSESASKNSPKAVIPVSVVFGSAAEPVKSVSEATSTTTLSVSSPNVEVTLISSTSVTSSTTSIFTKPAVSTSVETPNIAAASVSQSTAASTTSLFTFSTSSPISFSQTTTTTVVTTGTSIFVQTPTTTASIFGQVSSTTPTTNIFGGGTPTTPTTNIFGGSTKPIFGQASVTTTSVGSIFGGSTPTTSTFGGTTSTTSTFGGTTSTTSTFGGTTSTTSTFGGTTSTTNIFGGATTTSNAFGQTSTSTTSSSTFGQKPDAVTQTANIFGQLLSDSNRAGGVFGTTTGTPTTSPNIFSTPKNIFGGPSTTTASLFGTSSSSIFPQETSVFGQTTTASGIFGQSQTSSSNTFFGQNVCSPFGGGTSVTSNQNAFESGGFNSKPNFGQSLFGQTTNNTSIFGGSPVSSIFGNSSTSPSTVRNVFQTPTTTSTTNSTFGSTSPGPFSSGQGSVAETGFRAANSFQKPLGGFGSPPVFGGAPSATPAFGAAPAFSSSASFGSPPTFGSRPGVFDSSQGGFNQSPGHSTTFENLANQNTVGFGNLAQQSQSQGFGGVGGFGSSTFENKPTFGGDSFSNWR